MAAVVDQVARRPETKKRHTKPCRFYQTRQCPFSAEECDFVHISANEYPSPPSTYRQKVCRYFLSGNCTQGPWCRFRHSFGDGDEQRPSSGGGSGDFRDNPSSPVDMPNHQKRGVQNIANIMTADPRFHTSATSFTQSPVYFPWPLYADPVHLRDFQANSTSPTACEGTAELYASSESSGSVTDDATRTTTVHANHYPTTPPDALPSFIPAGGAVANAVPACGGFSVPPTSYFGFYPSRPPSSPTRSTRSRSQSRPRQKSVTYKTKPCKYYKPDSTCPKGEQCTFIHDPKAMGKNAVVSPAQDSGGSENKIETTPSPQSSPPKNLQHELPMKPISLQEENKKRGFFPISWRVIGGGVMIGRPVEGSDAKGNGKEVGPPLAIQTSLDGPASASANEQSRDDLPISAAPARAEPFPTMTTEQQQSCAVDNEEEPIQEGKVTPRARSMSIPPTPTFDRVDVVSLFSAESPGGL